MRVSVHLTLDIDAEAWEMTYRPDQRPGETQSQTIRRDVREHVENMVQQMAPLGTGEVPGTAQLRY